MVLARPTLPEMKELLAENQKDLQLTVTRAMEQWEERGEDEEQRWTNMELAKDEHAQAKYVYVEMAGKERFCREIRDGDEQMVRDVEGATERMEESRQEVKDAKVHVTEFKDSITALISQTLVKKEEFEAEVDALSKIVEEREAPGADGGLLSEPEVADAEAKIVDKQQLLQRVDEGKLKDLHQEKQQLEVSVRTKNEEIETSKPGPGPNFRETKNRRMAAWYRSANTALCSLANVVSVTMAESAAEVEMDILPYTEGVRNPATAPTRYTLVLAYDHGDDVETLKAANLSPNDVDITDLEDAALFRDPVTDKQGSLATLLSEVKNRVACRLALEEELSVLRDSFSVDIEEENGAVVLRMSPKDPNAKTPTKVVRSPAKPAPARWHCEVVIDMDYPRSHAPPSVRSFRKGTGASPGKKRERGIEDAVNEDHKTVTSLVTELRARLGGQ